MNPIHSFIRTRISHRPNLMRILENISWLFFDKFLRMGVGLLVGVWIARYLGPEQFGLLGFASAFIALFGSLATLGLQPIVVRNLVDYPQSINLTLGTAGMMQAIGGVFSYLFMLLLFSMARPNDALALSIVAILGSVNLFKFFDVSIYWFESQIKSKYVVWIQNTILIFFAVAKVILITQKGALIHFVWISFAEALLTSLAMLTVFNIYGSKILNLTASLKKAKILLTDSWPLILTGIAVMFYMRIDQIMLGAMIGDEAVGIYSAAVRISEAWYFIPVAMAASLFPQFIEAKKSDEAKYYMRFQKFLDVVAIISVLVALPLSLIAEPLIIFLFGKSFAAAGSVLIVSVWSGVFVFLWVASNQWFFVHNRQILNLRRALYGAISNIVLNYCLIPNYGALGAAYASLISYSIAAFFSDYLHKDTRKIFYMKLKALNLFSALKRVLV